MVGIKVKFQASLTFWFQPVQGLCSCGQQFSSGGGSAFCLNNLGMCVIPLSIFLRELGVQWFCYVAEIESKLLPVPQPNS